MQPSLITVKPSTKTPASSDIVSKFIECCDTTGKSVKPRYNRVSDAIFYVDDVFSSDECRNLRDCIDCCPSLSFWNPAGCSDEVEKFRCVDTIEMISTHFSDIIWKRIEHMNLFQDVVISDDDSDDYDVGTQGTWCPTGLNDNMLFAKYPSNGNFAPHTDGKSIKSFNCRSFYSVIMFLNSLYDGGSTKFYCAGSTSKLELKSFGDCKRWSLDDSYLQYQVPAKEGRILFFQQSLIHEGEIGQSPKYIIRSDVLFKRRDPICDSVVDSEAYFIYLNAEELAEDGNIDESIKQFKAAFRLSPMLKEMLKQ